MSKSTQELMLNALKEIKTLKRQLAKFEKTAHEPIAIIGMGCRYPGGSKSPDAFWQNLYNGVDCITQQDNHERWNMDDLYDPNPDTPGKIYSKGLGIIDEPDQFDAEFFGVSPREADDIDPQHRLLLEVCHETMETAGYAPGRLSGSRVGVFVGIASNDYAHLGSMFGKAEDLTPWQGIGNAMSAAPCRISYLYNFKGPALALDTACSSSLTALHYACESLRKGECDSALTGGVHLVLNPAISIVFAKARMLAEDGRCKTFDAAADGYVRSEGCGIVMLKRLSDAVADGDNILALVKGTGINQDGKSQGFTAPNESAQEDCIRAALQQAQLQAEDVSYVEAHGTGTPLGDPIELGALNTVYCAGQPRRHPLLVGSAKTNIGHSEAAAGAAGLIKLIQSLQHRTIPPHINYSTPNPYIPWNKMAIQVTDKLIPWDQYAATDGKLRAGLSAFAFTGTNVHVILEEYVPKAAKAKAEEATAPAPWVPGLVLTSGKQLQAVSEWQDAMLQQLSERPHLDLQQIAKTCASGRDHYKFRAAFLAQDSRELKSQLAHKRGQQNGILRGQKKKPTYKVAFVFSGQGAQFEGMGQALYDSIPVFKTHFDQVAEELNPLLAEGNTEGDTLSLQSIMWGEHQSRLNQTRYTQPALFALEYALAKTWMHWGVKPDCVSGHSVGEITAATIAGVFTLEDACKLIADRARLMGETERGSMLVVFANESDTESLIRNHDDVSVCAVNGPLNTVVGGKPEHIEALQTELKQQQVDCRLLPVQHAFHTQAMEPILDQFHSRIEQLQYTTPRIRVLSNLNGQHLGKQMACADYWVQQIRQPVNFLACANSIIEAGVDLALEIGPGAALLSMLQDTHAAVTAADELVTVASQQKNRCGLDTLTHSLAQIYVAGIDLNWANIMPAKEVSPVILPTYAFQRKSYWNDTLRAHLERQELPEKAKNWLYQLRWDVTQTLNDLPIGQGAWLLLFPTYSIADAFASQVGANASGVTTGCYELSDEGAVLEVSQEREAVPAQGQASPLLARVIEKATANLPVDPQTEGERLPLKIVISTAQLGQLNNAAQYDALTGLMLSIAKTVQQAANVEVWFITESAYAIADQQQEVQLEQAMILGFAKNLVLELAGKVRAVLDVDQWNAVVAKQCSQIMSNGVSEPWIALREQRLLAPAITRVQPESLAKRNLKLSETGFYVIAGGTGSLGLAIAEWMVRQGAQHIALLSRSGVGDEAAERVDALRKLGAQIVVPTVDLADRAALESILDSLRQDRVLAGVVHAAGQFELSPIQELDTQRCSRLMANKVLGMQWLDELTSHDDLQFFAGYSSIASVWGSAGNFHYCAANQVVDAVIQRRHQQGKTAVALNWGPWAESGMVSHESADQAEKRGLLQISQATGTQTFGRLLASDQNQLIVADMLWHRFKPIMDITAMGSLFRSVQDVDSVEDLLNVEVELNQEDLLFKQELAECAQEERAERLLGYLKQQLANALQLMPDEVDVTQPLIDMGIDSLMAVEFKNRVTKVTEVELPVVRMLGGANLRDVAQWMADGYQEQLENKTACGQPLSEEDEDDALIEGVL
ncbi:MAG: SDR family NAD(P)-dependent oxidoreductase [Ketobacter sp.]|nr:MAG: SDR family NAD(P)-dependent oxidoreductase [Ketobacter sp.]